MRWRRTRSSAPKVAPGNVLIAVELTPDSERLLRDGYVGVFRLVPWGDHWTLECSACPAVTVREDAK